MITFFVPVESKIEFQNTFYQKHEISLVIDMLFLSL